MKPSSQPIRFTVPLGSRLLLLTFLWVIGILLSGVLSFVLTRNGLTTPKVRIATVMQDLLMFILPALIAAMLVTRRPAELLGVDRRPGILSILLSAGALLSFTPAMNYIVKWNESLSLPASMASIEEWMRNAEASAEGMITILTGPHTAMSLVMSILIVGIFAGFTEELFFRGALQRLLITGRLNTHVAVWITAIIFSAIHMQFFGFFPRLLLGALFGYLLVWTGSLWVPVIIHALNNTLVVISMWFSDGDASGADASSDAAFDLNTIGSDSTLWLIVSLIMTGVFIFLLIRNSGVKR